MKLLVLGGSMFLGSFVVDEMLRRGHEVAVLGGDWSAFDGPISRLNTSLHDAVESYQPDALLDMTHHGPAQAESVIAACAGKVKRSVHLSSITVYGASPICPVDENAALAENAPPDVAALIEADRAILAAADRGDLPAIIVRLPELYGARDPRCAEWFFAKRVLDGRVRVAVPDAGLHICHRGFVQNIAWGIAQALCVSRASGVYNLGEEKLYTVAQLAQGVARALDYKWDLYSVPGHLWTAPYARTCFFDLRKARAQLRYKDRMIPRDGLELSLAWLCQNPPAADWTLPGIPYPFDYAREDRLIEERGVKLAI